MSAPAASARARHVLVAEDNAVNRLFLAALLDRMGHSAHFVENGLEAVQAVQEHQFDIVLMDVHMPVMDGIAATEAIRQLDAQAAALPIAALTADAYADTRARCLSAGSAASAAPRRRRMMRAPVRAPLRAWRCSTRRCWRD
jgi:CheY-like chemotaxis protein